MPGSALVRRSVEEASSLLMLSCGAESAAAASAPAIMPTAKRTKTAYGAVFTSLDAESAPTTPTAKRTKIASA